MERFCYYSNLYQSAKKSIDVHVPADTLRIDVPPEATAGESGAGQIAVVGYAAGVQVISTKILYGLDEHAPIEGSTPTKPTPSLLQQVLTATGNAETSAAAAKNAAEQAKSSASAAAASAAAATSVVKPFAETAENAAVEAVSASKAAQTAQTAATASANAAASAAVAAGNAASAAVGSEQAAGASELKAAESENAAAESAQAALESKTAAATSEKNAAASAKQAKDIADSLHADYTTALNEIAALKTNKADKTELETVKQQVESITPDDSTIGEKPWSSKNIIDMLCPKIEESGNPVQCYPVAGYPLGVTASWGPGQEGSGTPSPENIRPIKGRDSVTVERCGENLLKFSKQSYKFTHYVGPFAVNLKAGSYYLSCGNVAHEGENDPVIAFVDEKLIARNYLRRGTKEKVELERDCTGIYLYANNYDFNGSAGITATVEDLMLVAGITAPTIYEPYTGQTNTLTLPETVYGGEVDAVSGEGQETWQAKSFDGTEDWLLFNDDSNPFFYTTKYSFDETPIKTICSHFSHVSFTGKSVTRIYTTMFTGVDAWKAYIAAQYAAGTPVQVCYKLATPVPFTATGGAALPALDGANTVITDADSVDVTGRADPIKRIEDLEAAVASIN